MKRTPTLIKWLRPALFLICLTWSLLICAQEPEQFLPKTENYSSSLHALAFDPDEQGRAYAVGSCGAFMYSSDFGENWTYQKLDSRPDLNNVLIFPASAGKKVIAFTAYNFYLSNDGGQSWSESNWAIPADHGAIQDAFVLADQKLIFSSSAGYLYTSTNDGQSWDIQQLDGDSLYSETMDFIDGQTGWVGTRGGNLYKTSDAGQNWELIRQDTAEIYSISYRNEEQGILLFPNHFVWQEDAQTFTSKSPRRSPFISPETTIHLISDSTFLIGMSSFYLQFKLEKYLEIDDYLFFDYGTVGKVVRRGDEFWYPGRSNYINSIDITTKTITLHYHKTPHRRVYNFHFPDPNHCWLFGSKDSIHVYSQDGSYIKTIIPEGFSNFKAFLIDEKNHIYYSIREKIYRFDGFRRRLIHQFDTDGEVISIKRSPDKRFLCLLYRTRSNTSIYKSIDRGDRWEQLHTFNFTPVGLKIVDNQTLYAFSGGDVDVSRDGGINWKPVLVNENLSIREIHFSTEDSGVFLGRSFLLKTENKGYSFTQMPFEEKMNRFTKKNEDTFWALSTTSSVHIGNKTSIYQSSEGGTIWEKNMELCMPLYRTQFNPFTGDLWAVNSLYTVFILRNKDFQFYKTRADEGFVLYPNPSNGLVQIDFPLGEDLTDKTLSLYDITGRLIDRYQLKQQPSYSFDWRGLSRGTYIVHVQGTDFFKTQKIMLH